MRPAPIKNITQVTDFRFGRELNSIAIATVDDNGALDTSNAELVVTDRLIQ